MQALLLVAGALAPVVIPQDSVLPVYGCGTGCRVETEQLSLPERMDDGWIRLKVRRRTWINRCDWETKECVDEQASGRAGPPVADVWLFADCKGEQFASSSRPNRSDAWTQDVYWREGDAAGEPKFQTVAGNPFMQWAKLCPAEGIEGIKFIEGFWERFRQELQNLKRDSSL